MKIKLRFKMRKKSKRTNQKELESNKTFLNCIKWRSEPIRKIPHQSQKRNLLLWHFDIFDFNHFVDYRQQTSFILFWFRIRFT